MNTSDLTSDLEVRVLDIVRHYWGFDALRPHQAQAIRAAVDGRDSLVVLPTGGGKSLCYQVPPVLAGRLDVVISPLISLMKDQVDGLLECGYPAAAINSGVSRAECDKARKKAEAGELRLLFLSPERLMMPSTVEWLKQLGVRGFAIDEAHCISHWGHDFRPEYRQLVELRRYFPDAGLHAYTATATRRVCDDIAHQLQLVNPEVLIGTFDRSNLIYRVVPRVTPLKQVDQILKRHVNQAAIVYTITRKESEAMADGLERLGHRARAYHAGMDASARREVQELFLSERIDVVAATVAFGMGIDRSDVRCVIHTASPKSIEHYQQETGRSGRDGLEAECVLLYSASDAMKWEALIGKSAQEANAPPEVLESHLELLGHMRRFATMLQCRHRFLSEYFGQGYQQGNCGACDVCFGEVDGVEDATVVAQKILSCVFRVGQRFGVTYVVDVLRGANTDAIRRNGHEDLSTYGLLREYEQGVLASLTFQLVDLGMLTRTQGERPLLVLNDASWEVLRGQRSVHLKLPSATKVSRTRKQDEQWSGVDAGLFESLRQWRRATAEERGVPAFVILGDATLRELAKRRPSSMSTLSDVTGVGERKFAEFGHALLSRIDAYCASHELSRDVKSDAQSGRRVTGSPKALPAEAVELFRMGRSVEQVMRETSRAASTVWGYLEAFVESEPSIALDPWVDRAMQSRVMEAIGRVGADRLRPIFDDLEGRISYDVIRLVAARVRGQQALS